jgi:prepilin-type N-terminal cleavage/methylation domain-containing protein
MLLKFRNNLGVTLIELMVVTVILGLISVQGLKLLGVGNTAMVNELKLKTQRDSIAVFLQGLSTDMMYANKYEVQTVGSTEILILTTRGGQTNVYKFTDHGFLTSVDANGIETNITSGYKYDASKQHMVWKTPDGIVYLNYYLDGVNTLLDYAIKPRLGVQP